MYGCVICYDYLRLSIYLHYFYLHNQKKGEGVMPSVWDTSVFPRSELLQKLPLSSAPQGAIKGIGRSSMMVEGE